MSQIWHAANEVECAHPPTHLAGRVAVFVFDTAGRIVVVHDRGRYRVPGESIPTCGERNWAPAAVHAVRDQVGIEVVDLEYLGWSEPTNSNGPPVADVRMIARIATVHPHPPARSSARHLARVVAPPVPLVPWLQTRDRDPRMVGDAASLAHRRWGLRADRSTLRVARLLCPAHGGIDELASA